MRDLLRVANVVRAPDVLRVLDLPGMPLALVHRDIANSTAGGTCRYLSGNGPL